MSGNAHINRRKRRGRPCSPGCLFCLFRPKEGKRRKLFRNSHGHRHNPAAGKKQKKGGR